MKPRDLNKQLLLDSAPRILDPVMIPREFKRRDRSLMYSRKTFDAKQELHLFFDSSPRYSPSARIHLLPAVRIWMPEVGQEALHLTEDPWLLANAPDLIISHQIHNLAPKSEHRDWFISDSPSCDASIADVAELFLRWVEPFFQDYSSVDGLLRQYEAGDQRPLQLAHFFVFVAAAYSLRKERLKALHVLEKHLGKALLRERYARAFEKMA